MAEFIPSPGHVNCPKCGGWQVLDQTKRKANGWPISDLVYVDCDHCLGKGEISTWVAPKLPTSVAITIDRADKPVNAGGWAVFK